MDAVLLVCSFWPQIRVQGTMCAEGRYHVLPQIRAFLADYFRQFAHNLQVIFLIERSTLWQELMIYHAPTTEENCKQNFHIRPNLERFFRT